MSVAARGSGACSGTDATLAPAGAVGAAGAACGTGATDGATPATPGGDGATGSLAKTGADDRAAPAPWIAGSGSMPLNIAFAIEAIQAGSGAWLSAAAARSRSPPRGRLPPAMLGAVSAGSPGS